MNVLVGVNEFNYIDDIYFLFYHLDTPLYTEFLDIHECIWEVIMRSSLLLNNHMHVLSTLPVCTCDCSTHSHPHTDTWAVLKMKIVIGSEVHILGAQV